ncbi:hypothetical protein [Microbacterium sp. KNMS]
MDRRMIGSPLDIAKPEPAHVERLRRAKAWAEENAALMPVGFRDGAAHVIVGERQTGKSRLAVEWLRSAPEGVTRVLVTFSAQLAEIRKQEAGLPRSSRQVVSYRQLLNDQAKRDRSKSEAVQYAIDDACVILADLLGLDALPHMLTVCVAEPWQVTDRDA